MANKYKFYHEERILLTNCENQIKKDTKNIQNLYFLFWQWKTNWILICIQLIFKEKHFNRQGNNLKFCYGILSQKIFWLKYIHQTLLLCNNPAMFSTWIQKISVLLQECIGLNKNVLDPTMLPFRNSGLGNILLVVNQCPKFPLFLYLYFSKQYILLRQSHIHSLISKSNIDRTYFANVIDLKTA